MTRLHRLGTFCATQPKRVLRIGATVAALVIAAAVIWGGELVDGVSVPGSDSQTGIDLEAERAPIELGIPARIVFVADHGRVDTPETTARINDILDLVRHQPTVDHVVKPIPWPHSDGTATFADVVYQPGPPPDANAMRLLRDSANSIPGVHAEIGGVLPEVVSNPDAGSET